jgi:hypothetical protein
MKIFAKRKRKAEGAVDSVITETKTEPDPVVQEILKQDPSTWNAKQRRLVKRYEERTKSVASLTGATIESQSNVDLALNETAAVQDAVDAPDGGAEADDLDETKQHDDQVRPSEGSDENNAEKHAESDSRATEQEAVPNQSNTGPIQIDAELQGVLDQLNSKQRRKLVRQLERGGNIEEVRLEASRLLEEGEAKELPSPKVGTPAEPEPPLKKARTRRPVVDPNTLTPEERLRREEQRRMQQAATEARQKEISTTGTVQHKHPLNSERRRANRRKPKWEPKSLSTARSPNEHDSSGYHMRRITKAER